MISTIEAGQTFFIEANDPRLLEEELDTAVDTAIQQAMEAGRHGVLVTRNGNTTCTVTVNARVPYGQMEEDAPVRPFPGTDLARAQAVVRHRFPW
ncbi:hypothetical protein [Arthrobacter sp. ISL-72]|uniref:hypothetical protein n=1 Tax=Arthrobacter sp. ISL-72 TaxID=2819114 RepID=UPI001BE92444|nr:hypothetical protein [Arthrobacter sp. ISL-72]MBT2594029.1 hypothetical protein [Arthrobacter sp. ISL-72]